MLFKNQYYYFIAGLADFSFDSMKLPYTTEEFREMLSEELKPVDLELINKYFLKQDNEHLLNLSQNKDADIKVEGKLLLEEFLDGVTNIKKDQPVNEKKIPPSFEEYIRKWLSYDDDSHEGGHIWEDMLTSLYMDYGMEVKNGLMSGWFELNLNIGNVLAAIYARKYGLQVAKYIVGNNSVAKLIREHSNSRDFGISQELEYFDTLLRIAEESDIYDREKKFDKFRWDWLEVNTVFDYFNIENIFSYLCKLQILERWVSLNAEEGEKVFRKLINDLKNETKLPEGY